MGFHMTGTSVPQILYGTAWKEDQTRALTELALEQGFRGIDTANQRKHYFEAAVGDAVASAIQRGLVTRDQLFLQTKYTFRPGQDDRLPYDANASITEQVKQSFASSLEHLQTDYLDSYLLHGPSRRIGLGPEDWDAWRAMEELYDRGVVRTLGISNVTIEQLQVLCRDARVRPQFVQNRCYATHGWDRWVRAFCKSNNIIYQGFSLLTANQHTLTRPELTRIAQKYNRSVTQLIFRFAIDCGMQPITGTTKQQHMAADLEVSQFSLEPQEVQTIEQIELR